MLGIYKITNPNGRVYIGQAVDLERRISEYKRLHCKDQPAIYNSLLKYGFDTHKIDILEECNVDELSIREGYYQDLYNSVKNGLNCVRVSSLDCVGYNSQETKDKRNNTLREKYKNETYHWTGKKHNKDTKEKMKNNNAKSKLVLDMETGIFYNSALEAATAKCISYSSLRAWLNGTTKNKSKLKYI